MLIAAYEMHPPDICPCLLCAGLPGEAVLPGQIRTAAAAKTSSNSATYSLQDGLWCWGFCPAPVNSFRLAWCWALCSSTHSFCTVFFSQAFSLVAMNVSYLLSFFSELLDLIFKASPGCGILAIWKCFYLSSKCEYFLMITEA